MITGIETVKCTICSTLPSCKRGGSSSLMHNHLKTHKIVDTANNEAEEIDNLGKKSKQTTLTPIVVKESLEEIIAKYAAIDGISFNINLK